MRISGKEERPEREANHHRRSKDMRQEGGHSIAKVGLRRREGDDRPDFGAKYSSSIKSLNIDQPTKVGYPISSRKR